MLLPVQFDPITVFGQPPQCVSRADLGTPLKGVLGTAHFQRQRAEAVVYNLRAVSIETGSASPTCLFRQTKKAQGDSPGPLAIEYPVTTKWRRLRPLQVFFISSAEQAPGRAGPLALAPFERYARTAPG